MTTARTEKVRVEKVSLENKIEAPANNPAFRWQNVGSVQILVPKNLPRSVVAGFAASTGGVSGKGKDALNLAFHVKDKAADIKRNWERFLDALSFKEFIDAAAASLGPSKRNAGNVYAVSLLDQQHTYSVKAIKELEKGSAKFSIGEHTIHITDDPADSQMTDADDTLLGVLTADCVPVLLYDKKARFCASIHAGWKGTYRDITERTAKELTKRYAVPMKEVYAAIGPAVGNCCYEVDAELGKKFMQKAEKAGIKPARSYVKEVETDKPEASAKAADLKVATLRVVPTKNVKSKAKQKLKDKKYIVDLKEANYRQLIAAGVPKGNIAVSSYCTVCGEEKFFSYRRDKNCGRQLSFVMLRRT